MERSKRRYSFWVVLLVGLLLPASLLATKQIWKAVVVTPAGQQIGSSILQSAPAGPMYFVASNPNAAGQVVQAVWLAPTSDAWRVYLCSNGGNPDDNCVYTPDGRIDLEGSLGSSDYFKAGILGRTFVETWSAGDLNCVFADGSGTPLGSGLFARLF